MKIGEIVSKCNAVFDNERICLRAEFDETSFSIKRTDVSGFSEVVEVPLASNCLVDCTINIWSVRLSNMVKYMIDGAITTILETPKSTLYPEKRYRLVAKRKIDQMPKYVKKIITGFDEFIIDFTNLKSEAIQYNDSDLKVLVEREPLLAPAIDAMKKPMEDE
ncbi:MAG: hypothetical protein E6907_07340 [Limosilactobacillus vaginalis]|nr:hypothetical protein [Limosilactobacillus vaginalis]PMC27436.1 hypothetical protein CJ225_06305 [Gardnerella vaginalis]